jgi:hypothetical protein
MDADLLLMMVALACVVANVIHRRLCLRTAADRRWSREPWHSSAPTLAPGYHGSLSIVSTVLVFVPLAGIVLFTFAWLPPLWFHRTFLVSVALLSMISIRTRHVLRQQAATPSATPGGSAS